MLLNLSNHPAALWPANQLAAAQAQFGGVGDMAFPMIDPESDTAEVAALAREYADRIAAMSDEQPISAVHLMGEMSFTLALTALLQQRGLAVYSSTTRRNVLEEKDGRKTTQFEFVRFRAYPVVGQR